MEQGSEEWRVARAGSLGASQVHEALARTKTGWGASRANLIARLVIERLTGQPVKTYTTAAMQDGIDREPMARCAYEFWSNSDVQQVGLIKHPNIADTHASPDGMVNHDGLVEIKCPQPAQHLASLNGEAIADKYMMQMQWQLRCCERQWCDFVSFCPDFPESMRIIIKRVERDDKRIAAMEEEIVCFLNEVREIVRQLKVKYEPGAPTGMPSVTELLMAG